VSDIADILERRVGDDPERIAALEDPNLLAALEEADWLVAIAEANGVELGEMPAPEVPQRYRQQFDLLVERWRASQARPIWGSIQRLLYEFYGLTTDEICRLEVWRVDRERKPPS